MYDKYMTQIKKEDYTSKKHDNFVRLAEPRVNKALDSIRIVGNLSNPTYYEYSADEVREILTALVSAVNDVKRQFSLNGQGSKKTFQFSSSNLGDSINEQ